MNTENFIPLDELCLHYQVEISFFYALNENGLLEIITIEQSPCIEKEKVSDLEKILRLHDELNINVEGIDTVLNLLQKIEDLQAELNAVKTRLSLYENENLD